MAKPIEVPFGLRGKRPRERTLLVDMGLLGHVQTRVGDINKLDIH